MKNKSRWILQVVLIIGFVTVFVIGAMSPEVNVVVKKATNICLECIGIGG